jgi:hypothetical protein
VYRTTTLPLRVSRVARGAAEVVASRKATKAASTRKDGAIVDGGKGRKIHEEQRKQSKQKQIPIFFFAEIHLRR